MSFGYGFGLPSWNTLAGGFSPASLFTQGEQGAWYDPSDLSTMFNDAAGTQPITSFTTNQPVGLLLDKSKGLVLGPELVTNGNFSQGSTGWSAQASNTIAVVNGELEITLNSALFSGAAGTSYTLVPGQWYVATATARRGTSAANVTVRFGSGAGEGDLTFTTTSNVTQTRYFVATTTTTTPTIVTNSSSGSGTIYADNVSIRALPGNHATASGSARPVLSKRYNLLERTEDFSNAYWTKTNLTIASGVIDPNGGSTAFTFTAGAVNATISRNIGSLPAGGVISCFIRRRTGSGAIGLWTGSLYTNITVTSAWQRVSVLQTSLTTGYFDLRISTSGDEVDVWHPDVRRGIDANAFQPAYQRVVTATDYDGDGFLPYLAFGGTQAMDGAALSTLITASEYEACVGATVLSSSTNNASSWTNNAMLADTGGYFSVGFVKTSGVIGAFNFDGTDDSTTQALAPPATKVVQQWHQSGNLALSLDGGAATTTASGNTSVLTGTLQIGRALDSVPYLLWRNYGALLRNFALTAAQRSALLAWMAQRTGVLL